MTRKKKKTPSETKSRQAVRPKLPVQFSDIRLVESAVRQAIKNDKLPTNSALHANCEVLTHKTESHLLARPAVMFTAWYDDGSEDDPAIIISASFQLRYDYTSEGAPPQPRLSEMITQLAMLHVWPYCREYLHSQTNRMGLPPLLLPLLAVPQKFDGKKKSKKPK